MDFEIAIAVAILFSKLTSAAKQRPELSPELKHLGLSPESFWEDFQRYQNINDLEQVWIRSESQVSEGSGERQFPAKWSLEEPTVNPGFRGDKGLVLKDKDTFAMIGRIFERPIELEKDSKLVVQYEVKSQNINSDCGGAFLKLYSPVQEQEFKDFGNTNPTIELVFGPDKCIPYTNEVHFGIKKTNPITNESEMKFLDKSVLPNFGRDTLTHLYTLIVDSNNDKYEIRIDGEVAIAGNFLDKNSFEPSLIPEQFIIDTTDTKPLDWDDRKQIPDPSIPKPEGWDDREYITDTNAIKPSDWNEDLLPMIPDPTNPKPEWWKDDVDGKWEPTMIRNPDCQNLSGCGPWEQPIIANPNYQGTWATLIDNPNYQGEWEPRKINNPEYYYEEHPGQIDNSIGALMLEFWSGSENLVFDNIYVGKHIDEAELIGNRTFIPKRQVERLTVPAPKITKRFTGSLMSVNPFIKGVFIGIISLTILGLSTIMFLKSAMALINDQGKNTKAKTIDTALKSRLVSQSLTKVNSNESFEEEVEESIVDGNKVDEMEYDRLIALAEQEQNFAK
ncbi:hypothetical protein TBLA_0A04310 [Henningerozyma blattae CBS 6284]|uniref:Calnexin n=1 Tax=Henningerozyma blattae (strain ATCC 34711 / CBS 6284 / DSM 70876 / NBRC 10599 / NRRL Y-10934 / UCD 77-7) TaxID=1071380 RepID=I2GVS4_HENB6|nr:hypothetical protein TBLA_0A04310 [Tetrapisispora blattae CBS 6284]CCH58226.1 hypothetical protein TBLA_0A04310 [Tetrapisispora blattae CBS 6284]